MEPYIPRTQPSRFQLFRYKLAVAGVPIWMAIAIGMLGVSVLGLAVYSIVDASGPAGSAG